MIFHTYGNNNTDVIVLIHEVMELTDLIGVLAKAEGPFVWKPESIE